MPDSEELALPLFVQAGIACTSLIFDPKSWINRRVETIELLSHEETRRKVSVDFTLSPSRMNSLLTEDGVVAPIALLTKEPRRNFDLRNESGGSVPVLGRQQNGEIAQIALLNAVVDASPDDLTPDVFGVLAADLRQVVFGAPEEAADALGFFIASAERGDRWRQAVWSDPTCRSLLDALWQNYVLFAVLEPESAARRVLKYSYGEDLDLSPGDASLRERLRLRDLASGAWRPDRRQFVVECPGAWRAASFHVEIALPEELRVDLAVLYDVERNEPLSDFDVNVNRPALYARDSVDAESAPVAVVEVAPERAGRTFQAAAVSTVVMVLLWLGVVSDLDAKNPGAAVSILLAAAALFSGLTAAGGRHRIIQRVFAASRRWLGVVALAALAASASLAMEIPDEQPTVVWQVCAGICSLAAARLVWSAVRAPA